MKFSEAINVLIQKHTYSILDSAFLTRSILSDLVGNELYDKTLIDVFCKISKDIDLYQIFKDNGLGEGRKILTVKYNNYSSEFTKKDQNGLHGASGEHFELVGHGELVLVVDKVDHGRNVLHDM